MIRLTNTLSGHLEEFTPMHGRQVQMFVCGPTVYDYAHIGNFRSFVIFDMVAKYLRYRGYGVTYVQNITDIDDKIINRAAKEGTEPLALAQHFTQAFFADAKALGVTAVTAYASATEHIDAIIAQVRTLLDKGFAYEISDGIYFDLSKFPDYGKLSGRGRTEPDTAMSRIDENPEKRNPGDFVLWKRSKPGEPTWESPWFPGRPGWHIEDTAIAETFFGPQYDLHGGGQDLLFPHHEAEIAQQEAASGKVPFVRYWLHNGFLVTKDDKMSKSLGNFKTVHELLNNYSREALRLYLLSAHYRSPLDFSEAALKQAEAGTMRFAEFLERLRFFEEANPLAHRSDPEIAQALVTLHAQAMEAMDDDFNTPKAIGVLFDLLRLGNQYLDAGKVDMHSAARIFNTLDLFDHVLGIIPKGTTTLPEEIRELVRQRQEAREQSDFPRADAIRQQIQDQGYQVDDTPYGPLIKKK